MIKNIDSSFFVWNNKEWAQHVNFEEFCEYILPYKVAETQIFDNWREYFAQPYESILEGVYCDMHKGLAGISCESVNHDLRSSIHPVLTLDPSNPPIRKMNTLTKIPYGNCEDYSILALAVMRAKGIPVARDYTPQWPFRSMGHTWNVLLDNSGKNLIFEGAMGKPGLPHKEDHTKAKVFRETYAINREIEAIYKTTKYIPPAFKTPFMKDVTEEYAATYDIRVDIDNSKKNSYAYLAVFDNREWSPIHWGKCKGEKVIFRKMGRNVVYLPVFFTEKGVEEAAFPFLLTSRGEVKKLIPNTQNTQTLKIYRKYPVFSHIDFGGKRMIGGRIEASNDSLFQKTEIMHTIQKATQIEDAILTNDSVKFRYWRYMGPDYRHANIAELAFYQKGTSTPIYGKIIGTKGSCRPEGGYEKEASFDGQLLTYFDAPEQSGGWAGMDFKQPVSICRVVCVARSDGNNIEIGNEYELFYWEKDNWISMGKKIAKDFYLEYHNCPTNALFRVHNYTKGNEERIFTYKDGVQTWW